MNDDALHTEAQGEQRPSRASSWLTLNSGDCVEGVLLGRPLTRRVHWNDNRYGACMGKACVLCADDTVEEATYRIAVNFAVRSGKGWVVRILERSALFFKRLDRIACQRSLVWSTIVIERHKPTPDKAAIDVVTVGLPITHEERQTLDRLFLHDLRRLYAKQNARCVRSKASDPRGRDHQSDSGR